MNKLRHSTRLTLILLTSSISFGASALNLFGLKVEGGVVGSPRAKVANSSTDNLSTGPFLKFNDTWQNHRCDSKKSGLNRILPGKCSLDTKGYVGLGITTASTKAFPIRFDLLFSYYPKYTLSYHGKNAFPSTYSAKFDLERYSAFINTNIDFLKINWRDENVAFFIQAGGGAVMNRLQNMVMNTDNTYRIYDDGARQVKFGWNIGVGVNGRIDDYNVGIGYRYVDFGQASAGKVLTYNGSTSNPMQSFKAKTAAHILYASVTIF